MTRVQIIPPAFDYGHFARCHCACHRGRSPLLTDQVEAGLACDSCTYGHYEAAAHERAGEPAVIPGLGELRDAR